MVPTDGTGHIIITDIGQDENSALICQSNSFPPTHSHTNWFINPTQMSIASSDRIQSHDTRGWCRDRAMPPGLRLVKLWRCPGSSTAQEGVFTCNISGDPASPISVAIYHPSEWIHLYQACIITSPPSHFNDC